MDKPRSLCEILRVMDFELVALAESKLLFWAPLGTLLISLLLSFAIWKLFPRWGLMDRPQKYGHARAPIPYPGGAAIVLAFLIGTIFFFPIDRQLLGFLFGGLLLALVSFWDDRQGVHPLLRLGVQVGIGLILIATGTQIIYVSNPFGAEAFELPGIISAVVTIAWVIGAVNTLNWLDGIPGGSAGAAASAGVFLGLLSLTPIVDQPALAALCFVFAAANLGFLPFNIAPPKMLNGDTGAMFSGFVIAVLSIIAGGKIATAFLVLALPLFDAATVIFHRLRERRSPLEGRDEKHLHDQLRKRGFSDRQIMLLFCAVSLLLGWSALSLQTVGKLILLLVIGCLVFMISWQHHREKNRENMENF